MKHIRVKLALRTNVIMKQENIWKNKYEDQTSWSTVRAFWQHGCEECTIHNQAQL